MKRLLPVLLAGWFGLIVLLGASGAFVAAPGAPPLAIVLAATVPLMIFIAAYLGSAEFHELTLSADLRLLAAIQGWRAAGLGFLALTVHGVLPGLFAWPAGLGDIAIGVTAPWVVLALIRRPGFAHGRRFIVWNLLGILDLTVAVTLGGLSSGIVPGLTGGVTTAAMAGLPLVLIPAFLVPLFIMLHLAALLQSRQHAVRREPMPRAYREAARPLAG